jgi:predicted nucleic acid-binding protein
MNDVFADTYYFVAMLSPSGEAHRRALARSAGRQGRLVTTAWVLTEVANSLHRVGDRSIFVETLHELRSDPDVLILPPDSALFEAGLSLYAARPDKEWSLTDCISFVVMQQMSITEALTGDHHFEQAGFQALLR